MIKNIVNFMKDESGLETVEYAVMTALIVAGIAFAITALAGAVEDRFEEAEGIIAGTPAP
jgi:Flp pilus assembly pilin Flp